MNCSKRKLATLAGACMLTALIPASTKPLLQQSQNTQPLQQHTLEQLAVVVSPLGIDPTKPNIYFIGQEHGNYASESYPENSLICQVAIYTILELLEQQHNVHDFYREGIAKLSRQTEVRKALNNSTINPANIRRLLKQEYRTSADFFEITHPQSTVQTYFSPELEAEMRTINPNAYDWALSMTTFENQTSKSVSMAELLKIIKTRDCYEQCRKHHSLEAIKQSTILHNNTRTPFAIVSGKGHLADVDALIAEGKLQDITSHHNILLVIPPGKWPTYDSIQKIYTTHLEATHTTAELKEVLAYMTKNNLDQITLYPKK